MLDWRCGTGKTWRRKGGIDVTLRRHCSFVSSRIHDSRLDSCVPLIVPLCCRGNNEHRQTFLGNILSWVLSVYWNSCKFAYNLRWDVLMVVRKKRTKILKRALSVLDSIIVSHHRRWRHVAPTPADFFLPSAALLPSTWSNIVKMRAAMFNSFTFHCGWVVGAAWFRSAEYSHSWWYNAEAPAEVNIRR